MTDATACAARVACAGDDSAKLPAAKPSGRRLPQTTFSSSRSPSAANLPGQSLTPGISAARSPVEAPGAERAFLVGLRAVAEIAWLPSTQPRACAWASTRAPGQSTARFRLACAPTNAFSPTTL